ncbi:SH3 domain-containing protein [uncultured Jannaschia sp.]|uniref:SH3 domain-containing protein n=1 Tax=uncultured Jannaschia sp. TaxID=293347 RepID=UPI002621EF89|nr:SH3 domain-containing protein [uncultured Jannaschia sp.]
MRFLAMFMFSLAVGSAAQAQQLDVPIVPYCDQATSEAACSGVCTVLGLDPNGDGFLAVRTGPGTHYRMIDKLVNNQRVTTINGQNGWIGIEYPGGRGWAHGNWLRNCIP